MRTVRIPRDGLRTAALLRLGSLTFLIAVGCSGVENLDSSEGEATAGESDTAMVLADTASMTGASWSLELVPSRNVVRLGEPVYLIARLTNGTAEMARFPDLLAPGYGFLTILVRHPGAEEESAYRSPLLREGRGKPLVEVPPGGSVSAEIPIYYGSDGWFLDREGNYEMRAVLRWEDLQVESPLIRLRVESPADAREELAAARFMSAGRFLFLGGGDSAGEAALREVAAEYPDTPWAVYARLALILSIHESAGSAEQSAGCNRTIERLGSTLPRVEDPVAAVEGYGVVADCLRGAGRRAEADRVFERYMESHPEAESLPGVLERLKARDRP